MPTTPAASPSSPSTKFTALIVTSTAKTVRSTSTPGEKIVTPTTGSETICTPFQAIRPAAMAWPASFVTASSCQTSSAMPRAHTVPAPDRGDGPDPAGDAAYQRRRQVGDRGRDEHEVEVGAH